MTQPPYSSIPMPYNPRGAVQLASMAPAYARPIYWAAALGVVELAIIPPQRARFPAPRPGKRPWLSVITADVGKELIGPDAFHHKSLVRLLKASEGLFVMPGAPDAALYNIAASYPVLTGNSAVLMEISHRCTDPWREFIAEVRPEVSFTEARHGELGTPPWADAAATAEREGIHR